MVLIRWDPFFEISRAHRLANRRLVGFPRAFASHSDSDDQRYWSIPRDIVRDGDNLTATASLPVVKPEDIDVTIQGGFCPLRPTRQLTKSVKMAAMSSGRAGPGLFAARREQRQQRNR